MLWITEVEVVHSLDELKSSRSVYGKRFPKFEMLDAKIASALNKIILNSQFKKKVSLEEQKSQKEDRFLRGRQIAFMIFDYFRVTGAQDTVLDYADLFSVTLRDDNIQELDTRWDEVLLSMSKKFHPMKFLESLYKLSIRESDRNLKSVLELHDMEIHQKIPMPNYQKLKTMVKRCIGQKRRFRNFDARNERSETGAVVTRGGSMTSMVAVFAILCHRVVFVQPPTATVCSGEASHSFRSATARLLPSLFVVAPASSEFSAVSISSCGKRLHELRVPVS